MKTKNTRNILTITILLGAATLFALPLQAGRGNGGGGGGGAGGVCPNGYEAGTRSQQDCTGAADGSGSQYKNKSGSNGQKGGNGARDGSGQGNGQRKGGQGTGNPDDCPNYNADG
jgi:hypothetical protein